MLLRKKRNSSYGKMQSLECKSHGILPRRTSTTFVFPAKLNKPDLASFLQDIA
jgi:hypothetical protein